MRYLSKKQKHIIIDYIKDGYFNNDLYINKFNNEFILLRQLEKVNDYETLYTDYHRLKSDLIFINTIEDKIKYVTDFK